VDGVEYDVAFSGNSMKYIAVKDPEFVTPEGFALGVAYGELLDAGGSAAQRYWGTEGCYVCLPSRWAAGIGACNDVEMTSKVRWFFQRPGICELPLERGFFEVSLKCGFDPRIQDAISRLSWESVRYGSESSTDSDWPTANGEAAAKLLRIGRPATAGLIGALQDRERAVAAHLLLSQIYYPNGEWLKGRALVEGPLAKRYTDYTVLGLTWRHAYDKGYLAFDGFRWIIVEEFSVSMEARTENFKKWCRRVPREYRRACKCAA
jgi:hypothetical protein